MMWAVGPKPLRMSKYQVGMTSSTVSVASASRQKTQTRPMPRPPKVQKTTEGYEIPVPKRGEFDANLDKLLKAPKPPKKVAGRRPRPIGPPA